MTQYKTENIQTSGYEKRRLLSDEDLGELRRRINSQIHKKLNAVNEDVTKHLYPDFDYLNDYHKISNTMNHKKIWSKNNRLLSEEDTEWFMNTASIQRLFKEQKTDLVSDEEKISRFNFYWRLTRPLVAEDVGGLHRDEWFWILNDNFGYKVKNIERIKIWIAVQTEVGKNGLRVVPESHNKKDIEWEGVATNTIRKPVLKSLIYNDSAVLLDTAPGEGVVFHDQLLHGGAINRGKKARCSIEFTLLRYKHE